MPPSTTSVWPVMWALASEAKRSAAPLRSFGPPSAPRGVTDLSVAGTFDAVASIEMVEAVGEAYWPNYLATIARVLKPGGRAAVP